MKSKDDLAGEKFYDVVVVGGGTAGLGMSYWLNQEGYKHVVLECGKIGETWRTQRWDSFAVNSPNWSNMLPGDKYEGSKPDGFWVLHELIKYLEKYTKKFNLPVETGTLVTSVRQNPGENNFLVGTKKINGDSVTLNARNVVIASGGQRLAKIPAVSKSIPLNITQLPVVDYRNPKLLPQGGVVVVGSAQSGCQITEELLSAGREVYLCTSKVGRVPRRYRGRDIMEWLFDIGYFDTRVEDLKDPALIHLPLPHISGLGRYGHTLSLQFLSRKGATLLGRLTECKNGILLLSDSTRENVGFADSISAKIKQDLENYIQSAKIEAQPIEPDEIDKPDPNFECVKGIERLDLKKSGISTIIWATGMSANFDWISLPVLDKEGAPIHTRGVSPVIGLYFLGFPWLYKRKSGIINGIQEDSEYIANQIKMRLKNV